jgi:hypothetical protein
MRDARREISLGWNRHSCCSTVMLTERKHKWKIKGRRCRMQNERQAGVATLLPSLVKQREVRILVFSVRVLVTESGHPTKTRWVRH